MIQKIMETSDPVLQKKCGRMVKNFDIDVWKPQARDIVKKANLAKVCKKESLKGNYKVVNCRIEYLF